jgi:hypothetical protein
MTILEPNKLVEAVQCYFAEVGANELLAKKKVKLANECRCTFLPTSST